MFWFVFKKAYAQTSSDLGPPPADLSHLEKIIITILNLATTLAVIAVFLMFVLGGFRYLTAGGDPKATATAKSTLTYAVLGLVLMFAAWLILRFVSVFTGVDVTQFSLKFPE